MKSAQTIIQNTGNCSDGGTYSASGTHDDVSGNYDITIQFNACREENIQLDGTYRMTGTANALNFQLGTSSTPFTILQTGNNYATLISKMDTNLAFVFNISENANSTSGTFNETVNGTMNVYDYINQQSYDMTFINFNNIVTYSNNGSTMSTTTNGKFTESWTQSGNIQESVALNYNNFKVDMTKSQNYEDSSINGTVIIDFTPDSTCFEGTFVFVTITPIRYDYALHHNIAGTITINGTTTVTWNANGSITVTTGNETTTYSNEYELAGLCDFETFNEEIPPSSGTGGGTVTGNKMTITLTWSGGATSDMDLHLNYYNITNPTSSTLITWYVDWHADNQSCENPTGLDLTYGGARDLNGDGLCDVGLDYDDTEGFGPEHITATILPAGYYVVSVNSYSLDRDPQANISVTIQIGNSVFGPYTHTFTTADYEGNTPDAWFPVADIRVNPNGSVDVLSHDPNLPLWHEGHESTSFMPALKKRKKLHNNWLLNE